MSVAEEKSKIKLISSVIESIKPSFSDSEIDQETLAKLEQLWIKKLKILEGRDQDKLEMNEDGEEGQTSGLVTTSSCAVEAEADENLETIMINEEIDGNDDKDEVVSSTDVLKKDVDVEEHNIKVSDI